MLNSIRYYLRGRFDRFYSKSHWHAIGDIFLISIVFILIAWIIALYLYHPNFSNLAVNYRLPDANTANLDLDNPPLQATFSVDKKMISLPGKAFLKIRLKNGSQHQVTNVSLNLNLLNKDYSLTKIELNKEDGLISLRGQEIIITKINPLSEIEFNADISLLSRQPLSRTIAWQAEIQYFFNQKNLKKTWPLPALIAAAELNVSSVAYYTSPQGDQLGIGPIPPIVEIPTNYWLFWDLKSNADLDNIVLSARLPQGIELTGSESLLAGTFTYNTSSRQIIWKVKNIKANSDNGYRLGLEVQLIPKNAQIGQVLPLIVDPRYRAEDNLSRSEVNGKFSTPDTNLSDDRFNSGQGQVINQ